MTTETKQRYHAFWDGNAFERCCLYLTGRSGARGGPRPESLTRKWEDPEYRAREALWHAENTIYYADAFPAAFVNCGPGCLSAMLGGTYRWAESTVWFENEPVITDWATAPAPALQRSSTMYQLVDTLTGRLLDAGKDGENFFTTLTDIGGAYDILAALRGTQNLLLDLHDHPAKVIAWVERLRPVWLAYFRQYCARLLARQGCVTAWMRIWSDRPWYPLQCDFAAMISPEMFGAFVLPDLRRMTEQMDRSVYHLDGPGQLPHVEQLLSLPRLNAVQWTPGDGNESLGHPRWFGLYEEIQRAGKGLVLLGVKPGELEPLLRRVSTKGLYISCGADAATARELVRMAEKFGVK